MAKLNFQEPFLHSSVSRHHSEIILIYLFDGVKIYIFNNFKM